MFNTPVRLTYNSSPPAIGRVQARARFNGNVRMLQLPVCITIATTTLEKGCYYVTTTREMITMDVFYVEICEVYGDSVVYRIAPQPPLLSPLTLEAANVSLQNTQHKVGNVNTSSSTPYFEADGKIFYLSLMTKLI